MAEIKTYSEQVTEYIKRSILEGSLNPGDKVNEVHVAASLSISRAPVREALQMLTRDGLIVSVPQKGKFINCLTKKQIKESYFTGGVLEGAAVAASIDEFTENDFDTLQAIVDRMEVVASMETAADYMPALDDRFHEVLFSKTDNTLLVELSRRYCHGLSKFLLFRYWRNLFSPRTVWLRHKSIVDALKTRDKVVIERALREHYIESGERMSMYGCEQDNPLCKICR
ncbi:GntR family transcriptional regulator [Desulfoluna butyratoxydans]|uniref:Transcription regulator hth gntr n=1 Tax=Desulfoluna butyratoxydans TaxID=231438 RepID=A0A4U8YL63_9BACT|nr:GntR family transcriptional regulator [Desulfoluna butyratoxydans]VFQ44277.1 transcription regulator hth gntr [Desulfoluna butyratoxydans]